ncbi:hypothetical protein EG68_04308 [Paragonimus skrjabini miyazakii]|uniref:Uncharacterized protein n=1 Tax=Paragonimus skrjabini miyazakii TaxID=59628 RepID=A0A8S9YYA7_9TREM|nr:hypothetical protein EG68_04308 [Paragonimus skrjabini miyazakii]
MVKFTSIFNGISDSGNTQPSQNSFAKCGLYQLKLSGTMFLSSALVTMNNWQSQSAQSDSVVLEENPSYSYQSVTSYHNMNPVENLLNQVPFPFTQFVQRPKRLHSGRFNENREPLSFPHTSPTDQYRDRASCAVDLSDFNKSLGSSGEFDNILRVHSSCLKPSVQYWGNGTHQCLSVYNLDDAFQKETKNQMLITYTSLTDQYFCWIFQQSGSENAVKWTAYLFSTPQCQYKQTETGGTIVSVEHALAWMDLKADTTEKCTNCHDDKKQQKLQTSERIEPSVLPQLGISRGRQILRRLAPNPASRIRQKVHFFIWNLTIFFVFCSY